MKFGTIFHQQNVYLKLLMLLMGVVLSAVVHFNYFLLIFGLTVLYMIPGYRIFAIWGKIILRLLPFLISYFLFALLVDLPFPVQINFACRIIYLLLLSLYLLKTTTLYKLVEDSGSLKHSHLLRPAFFYFVATMQFIPIFTKENTLIVQKFKSQGKITISKSVDILLESFMSAWDKIPLIEEKTKHRLSLDYQAPVLFTFPNLLLYFMITVYVLVAAL
jgi:energy-coupling factor transporter transmembrane protein EcfT